MWMLHSGHNKSNFGPLSALRPRCMVATFIFFVLHMLYLWQKHMIPSSFQIQLLAKHTVLQCLLLLLSLSCSNCYMFDICLILFVFRWGRKLYQDLTSGLWPLEHPTGRRNRWLLSSSVISTSFEIGDWRLKKILNKKLLLLSDFLKIFMSDGSWYETLTIDALF